VGVEEQAELLGTTEGEDGDEDLAAAVREKKRKSKMMDFE
jgi:hypothetical protein